MKFYQIFIMIIALAFGSVLPAVATAAEEGKSVVQSEKAVTTININTATAQQLAEGIKGVGQKKAELIVEYREKYGKFATVEELTQVKGIGKGTLQANAGKLAVE